MSFLSNNQDDYQPAHSVPVAVDADSKTNASTSNLHATKIPINPNTTTSNTASHQHQQEQELLSSFAIPNPPISTQQSSVAAEKEQSGGIITGQVDPPRTLWMGDLDPWLDENGIADVWWQVLHKKVNVKIIKPKTSNPDTNYPGLTHSGYCFVEFESFEDAQQALSLNGQLLPDIAMPSQQQYPKNPDNQKKYFRLNWASGATLSAPIVQTPEYSLFVGDLSASTTEAHLLAFFQKKFPTSVKTVRVMTDPVSGKSRCFGFVRFTDESERQRALVEMNGAWFGGRPLRVALATPRATGKNRYQNQNHPNFYNGDSTQQDLLYMNHPPPPLSSPYGYFGNPQMPPPGSVPPMGIPLNSLTNEGDAKNFDTETTPGSIKSPNLPLLSNSQGQPFTDPNNTTVFVGGLSSDVTEQTLFTLFKPFGVIQQVKIPPGKNCGFIKYSTREEAEEAIAAMQGFIIGGNRVRLSWGRVSINNKKYQQQQQQVAQAAQIQAAAALSMGMDPASAIAAAAAAAAAGYPPLPGQLGGIPQIGMPPPFQTNVGLTSSYDEKDFEKSPSNKSSFNNESNNPIAPPFYMPIPPADYGVRSPQDDLANAMSNMNLGANNREKNDLNPKNYINPGYSMPPMFNGGFPQDAQEYQYQDFVPPPHQSSQLPSKNGDIGDEQSQSSNDKNNDDKDSNDEK